MKKIKITTVLMCTLIVFSGCGSTNNTTKGTGFGAAGGAILGGIIGNIIGKNTKGTIIGAAVGTAIGAGTGAIIGKKMDKKAEEARKIANAQVSEVTDANGLKAVKVTFDSGILFDFNKWNLNVGSKKSLSDFANILREDIDTDIAIYGYTDKVGTEEANLTVSNNRANTVRDYLSGQGVNLSQFKTVQGLGYSQYDESLTAAQNRKVEVYMYAGKNMINKAQRQANN